MTRGLHLRCWVAVLLTLAMAPAAAVAGGGVVVLQTADPACPDDSGNVYVDCGNGTVTDTRTGLVWLQDTTCFGYGTTTWFKAMHHVAGLSDLPESLNEDCQDLNDPNHTCDCNLSDGSSPGEWRLPSIDEWHEMTAAAVAMGCVGDDGPSITSDDGLDCWSETDSFAGIQPFPYWSASPYSPDSGRAFAKDLGDGSADWWWATGQGLYVWPVRAGQ